MAPVWDWMRDQLDGRNDAELLNLFGYTGRVIPHDGLNKLQIQDGKLVIQRAGMRATLPRPKASILHPADWKFLTESLEKARTMGK